MIKFYTVLPDNDHLGGARQATKVSIALQEIGEPFETIDLDRRKVVRPLDSPYRKINPNGRVPAIDDDGFILWEAAAILEYLVESRESARWLLPGDVKQRAQIRKWLIWESSTLTPDLITICALATTQEKDALAAPDVEAMVLAAGGASYLLIGGGPDLDNRAWNQASRMWDWDLRVLEEGLDDREFFGGTFSIADIALGVVVPIAFLTGMSVKRYPRLTRWIHRLAERESFRNTSSFMNHLEVAKAKGLL
jgi:glutathione S-transferase